MSAATILISWIGKTDTGRFDTPEVGQGGPLRTLLEHRSFDELHLLFSPDDLVRDMPEQAEHLRKAIADSYPKMACTLHPYHLLPTDIQAVYDATEAVVKSLWQQKKYATLLYNLTSGTSAMYAALLLLGSAVYPGELLRTTDPKYTGPPVSTVTLPFHLPLIHHKMQVAPQGNMPIAKINQAIFDRVAHKISPSKAPIIILGESGVGKTQLANFLHSQSPRAGNNMVSVNCAALPSDRNAVVSAIFGHEKNSFTGASLRHDGAFLCANGSTLFLDEIGDLPLDVQGTLLTVLDTGEVSRLGSTKTEKVDVRVIAATNKNLLHEVRRNRFRLDLYYRLATYTPILAPVREYAPQDRRAVLEYFWRDVERSCHQENKDTITFKKSLAPQAMHRLVDSPWPGNLRQMRQCLYSLYLLSDNEVTLDDVEEQLGRATPESIMSDVGLPASLPAGSSLDEWLVTARRHFINEALHTSGGIIAKAARRLGMKDSTLRDACSKLGIQ